MPWAPMPTLTLKGSEMLDYSPLTLDELNTRVSELQSRIAWRIANTLGYGLDLDPLDIEYLAPLGRELNALQDAAVAR